MHLNNHHFLKDLLVDFGRTMIGTEGRLLEQLLPTADPKR
jgi:hypothetical protein